MATQKTAKPDPLHAAPDGTRLKSAWLTKMHTAAEAAAMQALRMKETNVPVTGFLPANTVDANHAFILSAPYFNWPGGSHTPALACLAQWHGDAALPFLAQRLDARLRDNKDMTRLIASLGSAAALDTLLRHLDIAEVRDAVAEAAGRWPLFTLRALLALDPKRGQSAADLLQRLLHAHPDWLAALHTALEAAGDAAQAKTLARLLAASEHVTDARLEALPALLREPPWRAGRGRAQLPVLDLALLREPGRIDWSGWQGGSIEPRPYSVLGDNRYDVEWRMDDRPWDSGDPHRQDRAAARAQADAENWGLPGRALYTLGIRRERIAALLSGEPLQAQDFRSWTDPLECKLDHLSHLEDRLALALLRAAPPAHCRTYVWEGAPDEARNPAARLLKRFGAEHLDLLLTVKPPDGSPASRQLLDVVDWDGLALWLSERGLRLRTFRANATHWLLGHPDTAARALIPEALAADTARHAHARFHLHLLARHGHASAIRAQAARYGQAAQAAIEQLLATPPEALLPAQLPKLPAWLNIPALPRLLLAGSGHAVPLAQMPDALLALALCKGGMAYAGLERLQEAVTPDSLARLMRGLFEQWVDNAMPPKDRWIFELQGRLGDDASARALSPRIREWRSRLDRVRAYEGLEMLSQIGSDTALMLLAAFTEQKRYSDLAERAAKALTRIADERGLTRDELADRTVPTLGLDERGQMALDFGPRQFTARLDADLTPQVQDASGQRLKDLPKPGAKDDGPQAKAASAQWKEFKKQAKRVAATQTARLENAMCAQRRWAGADFMALFVQHPVLRLLAQRLVWAVFDAQDAWQTGFRIAEDATLADVQDTAFTLPPEARIGLPHPLEMPEDARQAWTQLLVDYELLQPWRQLSRATYTLPAKEAAENALARYRGRKVGAGSLLGLEARGWKRRVGDGGMIDCFAKPLSQGRYVELHVDEGWFVGGPPPAGDVSHELTDVRLGCAEYGPAPASLPTFADLGAIELSELLRDLEKMAWHTRP